MYSLEVLSKYIDIALQNDSASSLVIEILTELDQVAVELPETITDQDFGTFMNTNEVFIDDPYYYKSRSGLTIYNDSGKPMLIINDDGSLNGIGKFNIPVTCKEDRDAFLYFCDNLQKKPALVMPSLGD